MQVDIAKIKTDLLTPEYNFLRENKYLGDNIALLAMGGSIAYGTNLPTSDVDIRGFAINPSKQIFGLEKDFEQIVDVNTDTTIYSINKMVKLLTSCNPNTIEILGCAPEHYLYINDIGKLVLDNKKNFLSIKAIDTFGGYANAQYNRLEHALLGNGKNDDKKLSMLLHSLTCALVAFNAKHKATKSNISLRILSDDEYTEVLKQRLEKNKQELESTLAADLISVNLDKRLSQQEKISKTQSLCDLYRNDLEYLNNKYLDDLDNISDANEDRITLTANFYDYIIVDEFHHAAAPTYQKLLEYYKPKILLGLTATPERMDGKSVLKYFNNRIAAEIRLPEAIDRKLLCPFQYFGVTDTVDLDSLKWTVGGYDKGELSKIYTFSGMAANRRADLIINSLLKYVTDIDAVKGLGFCVSIEHAEFMCRYFNEHGIPSMYLTGASPDEERKSAKDSLVSGKVRFIFVVDIYNEGVDIPEVNTVLFLRPTESLTVFLQQLGRGLRLSEDKECLTVLDFIGQANKKYNFEDKFAALLSNTTRSVTREIKDGFVSVPKGCYIQLEKKAAKYILENIRASYGNTAGLITRVASFEEDTGLELTLATFLDYYHLDARAMYKYSSFSRLCARADVIDDFEESTEEAMTKAFARFAAVDSRRWIKFLIKTLKNLDNIDFNNLSDIEKRMLQMFYITVWGKAVEDWNSDEVLDNFYALADSPRMLGELIELLEYNYNKIDFIDEAVSLGFDCPLDLHCTYTRDQLLVAMDFMKPNTVREGVKWLPEKETDVFFITLNKSDKDYSPTTMYNDYSINEILFHWQSQSTTADTSTTGQRYIHHKERGSKVLLFVREFKNDTFGNTAPYTFLGTANYVKHNGSKPMNVTWKLDKPIPAKYLKKTNKLVVG